MQNGFKTSAVVLIQTKVLDTSALASAALDLIQEPTFLFVWFFQPITSLGAAGMSEALDSILFSTMAAKAPRGVQKFHFLSTRHTAWVPLISVISRAGLVDIPVFHILGCKVNYQADH